MAAARVLVVDDDQLVLTFLSGMLHMAGYDVLPATEPRQALGIIKNDPPIHVLLSDMNMPEMPGKELILEAAQVSPLTTSLLMTGGVLSSAEVPQGVAVLRKPIFKQDLLDAVQAAWKRSVQLGEKLASEVERSAELKRHSQRLISETQEAIVRARETVRKSREARIAEKVAMDALMAAALRVLTALNTHAEPAPDDVMVLRTHAPLRADADLDELACDVIQQAMKRRAEIRAKEKHALHSSE
jgi:DNA-binding NtrC family response regulator